MQTFKQSITLFISWWVMWFLLQSIIIHRLHVNWNFAFADAAFTQIMLALCGFIIINTFRFYSPGHNEIYRIGYIIALAAGSMYIVQLVLERILTGNSSYLDFLQHSMPVRYAFAFLMIVFLVVMSILRYHRNEKHDLKKRTDETALLLRDAELAALRQQLQPHFLFNSLNSISALAGAQPQQARKMIQQLSDFLRGTLKKDERQLVTLTEEMEHLQLYLEIEKVRFGHRLHTAIRLDDATLNDMLPSLLLQPVVENAIKFGLYDTAGEVAINITAGRSDMNLNIEISNPFDSSALTQKKGTGFGLNAVKRRLYLLYARNDLLSTSHNENTFITAISIPQAT